MQIVLLKYRFQDNEIEDDNREKKKGELQQRGEIRKIVIVPIFIYNEKLHNSGLFYTSMFRDVNYK